MPSKFQLHKQKWIDCQECELCHTRKHVVLVRGTIPCQVLFVGEAPGQSEDVLGKPFVGPAGNLLDQIIKAALPEGTTYALTNLVGCIPIGEEGSKVAEPPKESILACRPRLEEMIAMCEPELVVLVGTLAKKHCPPTDVKCVDVIHPAAILRADVSQRGLAIQKCIVRIETALVPF